MPNLPQRIAVTPADIERVVTRFYARTRVHPVLRPIFAAHVTDWPAHEAKIVRFWRGAILGEAGYEGSPMVAHRRAGNVRPEHFAVWLALFDTVLVELLEPEQAAQWSALAHRLGRGLRLGVEDTSRDKASPPRLG
ncbi:group III truncated hemoglobin [Phaeovulum sp.]|uniref:group III truncated hemoglobin n=1 Tax=Phaeovulum sp. TaxID=2934796 RepID=UPI0035691EEA